MALIICKDCGKEISDTAKSCPNCGAPSRRKNKPTIFRNIVDFIKKRALVTILISIIIILLVVIAVILYNNRPIKEESIKVDLQKLYNDVNCNSTYCIIASDGSYLEIDTNPYDIEDYYSDEAIDYIESINIKLGFTESLYNRMGKTRALDGTLTEENDLIKVSWTYHPDNGLAVTYSIKNVENIKQQKDNTY